MTAANSSDTNLLIGVTAFEARKAIDGSEKLFI